MHYLKGRFTVNLLATFHWELLFKNAFRLSPSNPRIRAFYSILKYLRLLKMKDILDVMVILKSLKYKKETKSLMFIVFYLVLVFIWVHFFACLFWFVTR